MRQRAVCAKRSANGKANASPWGRARGRALRHCLLAEQLQTIGSAIGEVPSGLGGFGRCHLLSHWRGAFAAGGLPAMPLGCHQRGQCRSDNNGDPGTAGSGESAASPKAPRQWIFNDFATRGMAMACALGRSAGHAANCQSLNVSCLTRSQCLAVSMSPQVSGLWSLVSPPIAPPRAGPATGEAGTGART